MTQFPSPDMEITRHLVISDLETSKAWYSDVLGAELTGEYGGTSAVFKLLGAWILITTGGEPTPDKPSATFAPPPDPDTVSAQMIFRVQDTPAIYELLTSRGAEFLAPPVRNGSEVRAFFRDPDGHLFEISAIDP